MKIHHTPSLRKALVADVLITGATALLLTFGAGQLAGLFHLPVSLLRGAGLFLLPFVGYVAYVASREAISTQSGWSILGANIAWAVASLALLLSGWVEPNRLGTVFIVGQALVVATFAELQFFGLRKSIVHVL